MSQGVNQYKIRLSSGRILGPVTLARVGLFVFKGQITGAESARYHPQGDWKPVTQFPEIADLILKKLDGKLDRAELDRLEQAFPAPEDTLGVTLKLPEDPEVETMTRVQSSDSKSGTHPVQKKSDGEPDLEGSRLIRANEVDESDDKTVIEPMRPPQPPSPSDPQKHTSSITTVDPARVSARIKLEKKGKAPFSVRSLLGKKTSDKKRTLQRILVILIGFYLVLEYGGNLFPSKSQPTEAPLRPTLPSYVEGKSDPALSEKLYWEGMKSYVLDNVPGYKDAARQFLGAAGWDAGNVKALAMLASSYLNLIEVLGRDEKFFSTVTQLIELSRAKSMDLAETVIAEVEFLLALNRPEAAQQRMEEYSRTHQYGPEMYYYLAACLFQQGDAARAARLLNEIPDDQIQTSKIFYMRGLVADRLRSPQEAIADFKKGLLKNKTHGKSALGLSEVLARDGRLSEAGGLLEFLTQYPRLLSPRHQAQAYYLRGMYFELTGKQDLALGSLERSVALDPKNPDYLLELYTLRAKAGGKSDALRGSGRMYYFLAEGEKAVKEGLHQEALAKYLEARQNDESSPLPLQKIGELFFTLKEYKNARANFEKALSLVPADPGLLASLAATLIESYEWDDAASVIRKRAAVQRDMSTVDKLSGDLYAKQGFFEAALTSYRKAMAHDQVDSTVYAAYARALMVLQLPKDAAFYYGLARRFHPFNTEAIIGQAKALTQIESLERGIRSLEEQLSLGPTGLAGGKYRARLLSAIADLQVQKGDPRAALKTVRQAMDSDPQLAEPWRIQAQALLAGEERDPSATNKALAAMQAYIDRNPSDPNGYLDRYFLYLKKIEYEKAAAELDRIFALYPKYPGIHFYRASLYGLMGNRKAAIAEFQLELKNHPQNADAMVSLGKEFLEDGAYDEALKQFNQAMQLTPQAPEPKHLAGYSNFLLKNYDGAVLLYRAALEYDKGNPLIYKRLGWAYRALGDHGKASEAFKKYLDLAPDAPDIAEIKGYI